MKKYIIIIIFLSCFNVETKDCTQFCKDTLGGIAYSITQDGSCNCGKVIQHQETDTGLKLATVEDCKNLCQENNLKFVGVPDSGKYAISCVCNG